MPRVKQAPQKVTNKTPNERALALRVNELEGECNELRNALRNAELDARMDRNALTIQKNAFMAELTKYKDCVHLATPVLEMVQAYSVNMVNGGTDMAGHTPSHLHIQNSIELVLFHIQKTTGFRTAITGPTNASPAARAAHHPMSATPYPDSNERDTGATEQGQ